MQWEELKALARLEPVGIDILRQGLIRLGQVLLLGLGAKPDLMEEAAMLLDPLPSLVAEDPEAAEQRLFESFSNFATRHNAAHAGSAPEPPPQPQPQRHKLDKAARANGGNATDDVAFLDS